MRGPFELTCGGVRRHTVLKKKKTNKHKSKRKRVYFAAVVAVVVVEHTAVAVRVELRFRRARRRRAVWLRVVGLAVRRTVAARIGHRRRRHAQRIRARRQHIAVVVAMPIVVVVPIGVVVAAIRRRRPTDNAVGERVHTGAEQHWHLMAVAVAIVAIVAVRGGVDRACAVFSLRRARSVWLAANNFFCKKRNSASAR